MARHDPAPRPPGSDPPAEDPASDGGPPSSQGVYGITVASDLVGTGVQNLRAYERAGLVDPSRTAGGTRLYSPDDVARLRRVQSLLARGLNLAGISMVLDLQDDNELLRDRLDQSAADPGSDQPHPAGAAPTDTDRGP